jgi:hypothetical protein
MASSEVYVTIASSLNFTPILKVNKPQQMNEQINATIHRNLSAAWSFWLAMKEKPWIDDSSQ